MMKKTLVLSFCLVTAVASNPRIGSIGKSRMVAGDGRIGSFYCEVSKHTDKNGTVTFPEDSRFERQPNANGAYVLVQDRDDGKAMRGATRFELRSDRTRTRALGHSAFQSVKRLIGTRLHPGLALERGGEVAGMAITDVLRDLPDGEIRIHEKHSRMGHANA